MKLAVFLVVLTAVSFACEEREVPVEPKPVPSREDVTSRVAEAEGEAEEKIEATRKDAAKKTPELPAKD